MSPHLSWLHSGDDRGVDERFGPLGRVLDERLPLPRQPHKFLLLLIEVRVHAVLEVGRSRDLDARLFLLGEHDGGSCRPASDLQAGQKEMQEFGKRQTATMGGNVPNATESNKELG